MTSCKKVRSGSVQPGGLHVMYSRVVCVSGGLLDLLTRSWQKPRFLPAETKLVSEKAPQATFSNEQGAAWYGNTVDGIGG